MPDPLREELHAQLRAEDRRLLIEQIRLACWNVLLLAAAVTGLVGELARETAAQVSSPHLAFAQHSGPLSAIRLPA